MARALAKLARKNSLRQKEITLKEKEGIDVQEEMDAQEDKDTETKEG